MKEKLFARTLLKWHQQNPRSMPWNNINDPYKIWLSEIMLQQTRVAQGTDYYLRFIKSFPDIQKLAKAHEDEVLKLWEGLGYYSRARNLHHTAKIIVEQYQGKFPDQYADVIALKGVGEYTAAAILSFAFNKCFAVVDGNVIRVLSRIFGIKKSAIDSSGKKYFTALANQLIVKNEPAKFNQAIMNFGALQCVPKNPNCGSCVFKSGCFAFQNNMVLQLPLKLKKAAARNRYFLFEVLTANGKVLIEKRNNSDIWKGLFQYPMKEVDEKTFKQTVKNNNPQLVFHQKLTHQTLHGFFILKTNANKLLIHSENQEWVGRKKIKDFAFPKMLREFNSIFLSSDFKTKNQKQ